MLKRHFTEAKAQNRIARGTNSYRSGKEATILAIKQQRQFAADTNINLSRAALHPNTVTWLDLVRSLCAQIVVLGHLGLFYGSSKIVLHAAYPHTIAVIIFFIIAGFLNFHSIANKFYLPAYNFAAFFIDRFSRIYPAYLASLFVVVLVDWWFIELFPSQYFGSGYEYEAGKFLSTMFFMQKINAHQGIFGSASQLWSLSIEWWLYMLAGYTVFTLKGNAPFGWRNMLALLAFGFAPICFLFEGNPTTGVGLSAVFLFGGMAYSVFKQLKLDTGQQNKFALIASCFGIFVYAAYRRYEVTNDGFDLLGAFNVTGAFLCSLWLSQSPCFNFPSHPAWSKTCRFIAGYSFSLYLTHYSLSLFLMHFQPIWAVWAICNVLAIGFAAIFENRYRELAGFLQKWYGKTLASRLERHNRH